MKSLYRYQKEHFKKITVKKELYEVLKKFADEKGVTIPQLLQMLIDHYIGGNKSSTYIGSNIGNYNIDSYKGGNIGTNSIGGNIGSNIIHNTAQGNTVTKCYEKSKMKYPVESNIAYFKSKGLLVDWWEEGDDRVCFELKASADSGAATSSRSAGKKYYGKRGEGEDDSWLLQYAPDEGEVVGE
jgi:hypothetical protein